MRSLGAVFDGRYFLLNVDRQVSVSRIERSLYDVLQLTKRPKTFKHQPVRRV